MINCVFNFKSLDNSGKAAVVQWKECGGIEGSGLSSL